MKEWNNRQCFDKSDKSMLNNGFVDSPVVFLKLGKSSPDDFFNSFLI